MSENKEKKRTKTGAVLNHLQTVGSITTWEAIQLFNATRLSAIIFNLNKKYLIRAEWCEGIDSFGNNSRWVRYVYEGERAIPLVAEVDEIV